MHFTYGYPFYGFFARAAPGNTRRRSLFRHVSLGAAGWPCLLQAFACWVPSAGPFSCIWRREWFCSHFIPPKPIQRPFAPSAAFSADAPCFGQLMPWISLQNAVLLPKGRALYHLAPRLLALWFRELQDGPVCCWPLRVGCRLPAHSAAFGDVHGSAHSASGAVSWPFGSGSCRAALFAAGLCVLGAVCRVCRPIQLHLVKRTILLTVLLELLATASLLTGLVSLAATVLANTQYSVVSTGQ